MKKALLAVAALLALLPVASRSEETKRSLKIVVVTAEQEYDAKATLPAFFKAHVDPKLAANVTFIDSDSTTDIPGLEALDDADLLVLYVRRRTLPDAQLAKFKDYLKRGKPLVALRTSSHAFETWKEFDREVLGCDYNGHYGKDLPTAVAIARGVDEKHPLLRGVTPFESKSSLYRSSPLVNTAAPVLAGKAGDGAPEPVAWTNVREGAGRVFYTSLGHASDFERESFQRVLVNAIDWALETDK